MKLRVIIKIVVKYSYGVQYLERWSVELLVIIDTVERYGVQYLQRLIVQLVIIIEIVAIYGVIMCNT